MRLRHDIRSSLAAVIAMLLVSACGGRTQLTPAYQIGRLSSDAVVASDAGVRVVARTDAWPGPSLEAMTVVPVELTFDNQSGRTVQIARRHVALVTENGQRVDAVAPLESEPAGSMKELALPEGAVASDERVTGFVYFPEPPDDEVALRIDLVDALTETRFGAIDIPFSYD